MLGREELIGLLKHGRIEFACEYHEPVSNMAESGALELSLEGARCKNLLLQDKSGRYYLVMTAANKSLELSAVANTLRSKRLSFASADRLCELLGVRPGSLSPLALVNDASHEVHLVIDEDLRNESTFLLHPLDSAATVALTKRDLEAFLESIAHPPAWTFLAART
ncbi:prolyl-tRNA synthetase associated domain-containing protein [Paraburkholderia xenovorans]|uniref:prolyl-tRNA synthetase associated domain-containing protein n=1 Tax=Paraburkholderia xenovorans TaxID=36873 RepID=UPI0038BC4976